MTRGRETNRLHVVAENLADARAQFIDTMERDPADRDFDHATAHAVEVVRDLIEAKQTDQENQQRQTTERVR